MTRHECIVPRPRAYSSGRSRRVGPLLFIFLRWDDTSTWRRTQREELGGLCTGYKTRGLQWSPGTTGRRPQSLLAPRSHAATDQLQYCRAKSPDQRPAKGTPVPRQLPGTARTEKLHVTRPKSRLIPNRNRWRTTERYLCCQQYASPGLLTQCLHRSPVLLAIAWHWPYWQLTIGTMSAPADIQTVPINNPAIKPSSRRLGVFIWGKFLRVLRDSLKERQLYLSHAG